MNKSRSEAFSDGVLAVAITLLALDLRVDATKGHHSLGSQLRENWPSFAAYLVSFFVIGVIWINHHAVFDLVNKIDRTILALNLMLLMWVTTIPFTTSTLADFLREGGADARWAVLLYGVSMEGMAISFTLILRHMVRHSMVRFPVSRADGRRAVRRYSLGVLAYPAVTALGLWEAPLMLAGLAALTGYYIVEQTPILPERAVVE